MKKNIPLSTRINRLDRRAVSFTVSSALIATVFLIALVGIFTGQFRPFASEISLNLPSQPVAGNRVPIPPAALQFDYSDGVRGTAQSNTVDVALGAIPKGVITLQGITKTDDTEKNLAITGKVVVKDASNNPITSAIDWASNTFEDQTKMSTQFNNGGFLDALDTRNEGDEVTYTIKPLYYLAVSAKARASDETITFPQAPVGDFNNDNAITGADFARWGPHFNQAVTAETTIYDVNKDGRIDEADFALAFTDNFDKTGESL